MAKDRPVRRRAYGGRLTRNSRGIYEWRRVHPITGRREKRSTGERTLDAAKRVSREWEDEFDRAEVGLATLDRWKLELAPLVGQWVESLGAVRPLTKQHARTAVTRALEQLQLRTAADLHRVAALNDRLLELERQGLPRSTVRRCYQDPLRRFSRWLAGNRRYLPEDPLACWEPLPAPRGKSRAPRRALDPDELARSLLALDVLDVRHGRPRPTRPVVVVALVAGPREGALLELDVPALDRERGFLDLGEDVGCKRRGAGALDARTLEELLAYVGERTSGPMFLSAKGARRQKLRLLSAWREAVSLALVDQLWPRTAPASLDLAMRVSRSLLAGRVIVAGGGPRSGSRAPGERALARRAELERQVGALVHQLRDTWRERMRGVDWHCLRKTHRTWARARGVLGEVIDRQLGWASNEDEGTLSVLRAVAGSKTGQRHYTDLASPLFDPRRSAEAVREVLDEALAAVAAAGTSLLLPGRSGRERMAPNMAPTAETA